MSAGPQRADRLVLVAVAVLNAITGGVAAVTLAPVSFGGDVDIFRRGAQGLLAGEAVVDFLYPPVTAALAVPLTWLPFEVAAGVMTALGAAILLVGCRQVTRGWAALDRVLLVVAVFGFIAVVNELLLGQVTTIIAAAIFVLARGDGRWRDGVPLGLVLATLPKPFLAPIVVWALIHRRPAAWTALGAALLVTLLGLLVFGIAAHQRWIDSLTIAGTTTRDLTASVWVDGATSLALALAAVVVVAFVLAQRHADVGAVAAVLAGLILAPYTLAYAATASLAIAPLAFRVAPVAARVAALSANLVVLVAFGAWAIGALVASVVEGLRHMASGPSSRRAPTSGQPDETRQGA